MIDFRYHIVSIVAVFLALGLGILLGTTVLDRVVSDEFDRQVARLSRELDAAGDRIEELRAQRAETEDLIAQVSPWVTTGRLAGRQVVYLDAGGSGDWRDDVRRALEQAGAVDAGSITLTDKWELDTEGEREELEILIGAITPALPSGQDPARSALQLLGIRLTEPTGRELVRQLADAGFLRTDVKGDAAQWPPAGALVVAFGAGDGDSTPSELLAAFASGTGGVTPTLVVAGSLDEPGAVATIRNEERSSRRLSTFDSAAADSGGMGVTLALEAAVRTRAGHFGLQDGLRYLPEPPRSTAAPAATPAA